MLTDSQIKLLKENPQYRETTHLGLKQFASDLVRSGQGDIKPDLTFFVRLFHSVLKTRLVRQEIYLSSQNFLERSLNISLKTYNRTEAFVKNSCDDNSNHYIWMRFDIPRVQALFGRCKYLLTEASFRDLVKLHSTIQMDKDSRLMEILSELELLLKDTILSINLKNLFIGFKTLDAETEYEQRKDEFKKKYLDKFKKGNLGELPSYTSEDENDK